MLDSAFSWNFFATDTTTFALGSILTDLEGSNEGKECIAPMMLYGLFFFLWNCRYRYYNFCSRMLNLTKEKECIAPIWLLLLLFLDLLATDTTALTLGL